MNKEAHDFNLIIHVNVTIDVKSGLLTKIITHSNIVARVLSLSQFWRATMTRQNFKLISAAKPLNCIL